MRNFSTKLLILIMLLIVIILLLWALNAISSDTVGTFINLAIFISAPGVMVGAVGFCVLSYLERRRHPENNVLFKSPERRKQLQLVGFFFVGFILLSLIGGILFALNPWKFKIEVIYGLGFADLMANVGLLIVFDVVLCIGVIQERKDW